MHVCVCVFVCVRACVLACLCMRVSVYALQSITVGIPEASSHNMFIPSSEPSHLMTENLRSDDNIRLKSIL